MKCRVAQIIAFLTLLTGSYAQLIFDPELLYLRDIDYGNPDWQGQMPVGAYTFEAIRTDPLPGNDVPTRVNLDGSLIFYGDGMAILNLIQSSDNTPETTGRLHEISLYKPAAAGSGRVNLETPLSFQMYFDGAAQAPRNWSISQPSQMNLNPSKQLVGPATDYIGLTTPPGGGPNAGPHAPNDVVQTFVFWFDVDAKDFGDSLYDVSSGNTGGELIFKWQGLKNYSGGGDSEKAIARLKPYDGGVVPVPEASTFLALSLLMIFAGGHCWRSSLQRTRA